MRIVQLPVISWLRGAKTAVRWVAGSGAVLVVLPILALVSDISGVASSVFGCSFPDWEEGCHSHLVGLLRPGARLPKSDPLPLDQYIVPIGTDGIVQLYLGTIGSADVRRLPTMKSRSFASPSLTKDRRSIVYVDSGGDVRAMAADGSSDELLMHPPQGCGRIRHVSLNFKHPRFMAVECRQEETKGSLLVMDTHGQIVRTLAVGLERVDDPNVSPDGESVAYWASENLDYGKNGGSLYSVPFDGSEAPTYLSDSLPGTDADPAFSPDGTIIAFRRRSGKGDYDVWLMRADGTDARPVLARQGIDQKPAWSPDGSHVLAVHQAPKAKGSTGGKNLVEIDVSTGTHQDLSVGGQDLLTPVWWHR